VKVQARATGRRRPLVPDHTLPPPGAEGWGIQTLRQLIERVVREEVAAFEERRAERGFLRVLTEREIAEGAERGRIVAGGQPAGPRADPDAAVGVALQAFEDGVYLVLLDGEQQRDLDAQVHVGADSTLTFIRLVALSGG
jgi:hypothetical protein